jgi:hypothetical protein
VQKYKTDNKSNTNSQQVEVVLWGTTHHIRGGERSCQANDHCRRFRIPIAARSKTQVAHTKGHKWSQTIGPARTQTRKPCNYNLQGPHVCLSTVEPGDSSGNLIDRHNLAFRKVKGRGENDDFGLLGNLFSVAGRWDQEPTCTGEVLMGLS